MHAEKIVAFDRASAIAIHNEAMSVAKDIKERYLKLFEILLVVERRQMYFEFDVPSLHLYCVELLELSKDVTKDFIAVVRKSLEVPELAEAIRSEKLTVPKARKICSVLTPANYRDWIGLAIECSCRIVERCVSMANPKEAVGESLKYVSGDIMEFKGGVTEEWAELLKRTKEIASQKNQTAVSSTDALFIAMSEYCLRNDPLEKAKRAEERRRTRDSKFADREEVFKNDDTGVSNNMDIHPMSSRHRPAQSEHAVNLRDNCQCVYINAKGERCQERRWLNKHHIVEFAEGGGHEPENLETLCWGHHKMKHIAAELASRDARKNQNTYCADQVH